MYRTGSDQPHAIQQVSSFKHSHSTSTYLHQDFPSYSLFELYFNIPTAYFLYQRNRIPTQFLIIQDVSGEARETRSIAHNLRPRAAKIAGREDGFPTSTYQRVADAYSKAGFTLHLSSRWGGWSERNDHILDKSSFALDQSTFTLDATVYTTNRVIGRNPTR